MKTPGNARGVPPLVLLQTRLAKCNFRPADVAPLVLLFALALLAAFSALVDAFTRTTVTGRRFPFGSLGNSWSRASSPGGSSVVPVVGVGCLVDRVPHVHGQAAWALERRSQTKTPQLAGVQLLSLPRLWLLAQASQ